MVVPIYPKNACNKASISIKVTEFTFVCFSPDTVLSINFSKKMSSRNISNLIFYFGIYICTANVFEVSY